MKTIKKITVFFLLFIAALTFGNLSAQQFTTLNFETLTIDDGLSQGFVSGITQDKKGFMWFATLDGLDRYDGYKFTAYTHKDDDSNSIASNFVYSAFEDSKQRLWISTWNNGLDYFDRGQHRFYHFFRNSYIRYMREDANGNLWTTINDTVLVCIKVKELKTIQGNQAPFILDTTRISFPANTRIYIMIDDKKHIYIVSKYFLNEVLPAANNRFVMRTILSFNTPEESELVQNPLTHKYYIQVNNELLEFANDKFKNPVKIADKPDYSKFFIDCTNHLWFGTKIKDINNSYETRVDLKTYNIKKVVSNNSSQNKFFRYIYSSYQDKNGTLWLATSGFGILKYSQTQNRFNLTLSQNRFFGLVPVNDSDLQVTYRLKLHINNDNTVRFDTLHTNLSDALDLIRVTDMGVDSIGNFWMGYNNKLIHYNPGSNKTLKTVIIQDTANKILSDKLSEIFDKNDSLRKNYTYGIFGFFVDKNYVLMCLDDLLISYNIKTKKIATYPFVTISKQITISLNYYKDSQGLIWINSDNSCYRLNIADGNCLKYKFNEASSRGIRCFCDDPLQPAKYIWLGTFNGLTRMNKQTGVCDNFYGKNGLPSTLIFGILSDAMGNLWISSTNGLYRMQLNSLNVQRFDVTDGLQSNEFNTYSYAKMKNGLLVFGGLNGLNFFKPGDIRPLTPPSSIITDIKFFGRSANFGTPNSPLTKDISYTNSISASYRSNVITIEFAGLDYSKKQNLQYRYKLKGFDEHWNYSGTNNTATYTNLDPGAYYFIVQASNTTNTWGPSSDSFQLNITPLWWQTWLFKIIVVLIILISLYFIYRYRLEQMLKVEKVRNRIASDLHDEIGSTLSAITIYSKVAQNQAAKQNNNQEGLLQKISDNTNQAMEAMNDIVWSINTKNDAFDNIIIRMQNYARQLLELKDYNVDFTVDAQVHSIKLKMEKRRDFYLIYKETLNNIVKHANGKNVWISMNEKKNILVLNIKDDGKGFDEKNIREGANGLQNLQKRAENINGKIIITSKPGEGTQLQLSFPY